MRRTFVILGCLLILVGVGVLATSSKTVQATGPGGETPELEVALNRYRGFTRLSSNVNTRQRHSPGLSGAVNLDLEHPLFVYTGANRSWVYWDGETLKIRLSGAVEVFTPPSPAVAMFREVWDEFVLGFPNTSFTLVDESAAQAVGLGDSAYDVYQVHLPFWWIGTVGIFVTHDPRYKLFLQLHVVKDGEPVKIGPWSLKKLRLPSSGPRRTDVPIDPILYFPEPPDLMHWPRPSSPYHTVINRGRADAGFILRPGWPERKGVPCDKPVLRDRASISIPVDAMEGLPAQLETCADVEFNLRLDWRAHFEGEGETCLTGNLGLRRPAHTQGGGRGHDQRGRGRGHGNGHWDVIYAEPVEFCKTGTEMTAVHKRFVTPSFTAGDFGSVEGAEVFFEGEAVTRCIQRDGKPFRSYVQTFKVDTNWNACVL